MVSSGRAMVFHMNVVILVGMAALAIPVGASQFLRREIETEASHVTSILEDLERVLGTERRLAAESRVKRLEEVLRPTFQAMPKDSDGGLRADAVRYTLHRLFVDRHGWYVKGLEPGGEAWNTSSPAAVFEAHAGSDAHDLFQARLSNHSFDLHHVAVLAATLETFVHTETVERLHAAYNLSGVAQHEDSATEDEVASVIDNYMMLYVLGRNHSEVTANMMNKYWKVIDKVYPTWNATMAWARAVRLEVVSEDGGVPATSFSETTKGLEEIADRYGRWQDKECQDIKTKLMKSELKGTGRIPIETFYASALSGNWQFSESVPYLRQLGVLDESDPQWPSVVIPNYVNSPSNCVASSKYYEVCCINECESLFGHLETGVAKPDASPARIVELVSALPSATVQSPRELSATLIGRLQEIAAQYEGVVPLHGRLFAQWMHHAYPRECPFPHLSGTTRPISVKQYKKETGEKATISKETMEWHVEEAKQRGSRRVSEDDQQSLPWTSEDELFVCRPETPQSASNSTSVGAAFKNFMLLAALFSVILALVRSALGAARTLGAGQQHKYMV